MSELAFNSGMPNGKHSVGYPVRSFDPGTYTCQFQRRAAAGICTERNINSGAWFHDLRHQFLHQRGQCGQLYGRCRIEFDVKHNVNHNVGHYYDNYHHQSVQLSFRTQRKYDMLLFYSQHNHDIKSELRGCLRAMGQRQPYTG